MPSLPSLHVDPLCLLITEDESIIEEFFSVYAKGNKEWFVVLDQDTIEASDHPFAKSIMRDVEEIARFLSKGFSDSEKEKRILDNVWGLTWVWH